MKWLTIILWFVLGGKLLAQTGMWSGGNYDGSSIASFINPIQMNIWAGKLNDGSSVAVYNNPLILNIWTGKLNDGSATATYINPAVMNIWKGGLNDGGAYTKFSNPNQLNIWKGGSYDGSGTTAYINTSVLNIWKGGNKDGAYTAVYITPPTPDTPCVGYITLQLADLHNITKHSATITWNKYNSGATSYTMKLRTGGVTGPVIRTIIEVYDSNTVTVDFNGLNAGGYYCISLQEHCPAGFSTPESPHSCFTTWPDDCPTPTVPQHLGNSGSSVSLGWTPGVTTAGVTNYGYEIELTPMGSTATYNFGGTITGTPMSRTVTCLPAGTFFTYKIREQCGVNKYSDSIVGTTYTSPGCTAPTNLATTVLNTQNARLSWYSMYTNETNKPYQLSYGVGITSPEAGIYSPVNVIQPANVSGNIRSHNFYAEAGVGNIVWYVREICGMCDTTAWAGPYTIPTIACTTPAATGMNVSMVTTTTAIVNWLSVNNNTAALLEVRNQSTGGIVQYEVPQTTGYSFTETVTGLSANTTYNWRVKQYCPNGDSTLYTEWNEFTTPGAANTCAAPTNQGIFVTFGTALIAQWQSALYLNGSKNYQVAAGMNITSPNGAPILQTSGYYRTQSPTNPTHYFADGNVPGFTWYVRDECSPGVWSPWLGPYIMGSAKTDETTTSINEKPAIAETIQLQLYPNPNNGKQLYINGINTNSTLTMYNLQGSVVLKQALQPGLNTLDISAIADAVYLCHINTPAQQRSVRLVIQR